MRGARLRYGAADQRVAARTEATLCVLDEPARLADQAALEASQLKARRQQALMAWSDAQQAFGTALQAAQRCEWLLAQSERLLSDQKLPIRRIATWEAQQKRAYRP